ncbi:carbohydrate binding domain-containing protein [Cohnella faecalis]|nr:carbohydrate binding domain-containing protein [Cohnella faecalis]
MKRHYRLLYLFSFLLLAALAIGGLASASPARTDLQTFTQPSGVTFQAKLQGDENLNWATTPTGDILIKDNQKYWNYAEIGSNAPKASGRKYGIDVRPSSAIDQADLQQLNELHPEAFEAPAPAPGISLKSSESQSGGSPSINGISATGTQRILVLLVQFSNVSILNSDADWSNQFFGTTGKTVRTYYNDISGGNLTFLPATESSGTANDGVVKVTLSYAHANKETSDTGRTITKDALTAANPYIDYASYDTNGDGYIANDELQIVTILAGKEESYGDTGTNPSVWGHKTFLYGSLSPTLDGKVLCSYIVDAGYTQQGEMHGSHMATIGILAHELGHMLGLPDLYDTDGSSYGIGTLSLMAHGSWGSLPGEFSGTTPSQMDAWSKVKLGFVQPTVVKPSTSTAYTLKSLLAGGYNVLKLPTAVPEQYFLVENRQLEGYDASISAASGGIAIWQIDDSRSSNSDDNRRWVELKIGQFFDPLYHSGSATQFGPTTTPNSDRFRELNGYAKKYTGVRVNVNSSSSQSMVVNVYGDYDNTAPAAPSGLTSTFQTASSVALSWNPSTQPDFDHYVIYQDGYYMDAQETTTAKYVMLNTSTSYTFSVKEVDLSGNESPASAITVSTTSGPDQIIVYYKRGLSNPILHYNSYYKDAIWYSTTMLQSEIAGYSKAIIPVGDIPNGIQAKITDGLGNWDDRGGSNYYFTSGINVLDNGVIYTELPETDTQAPTAPTNLASTGKTDTTVGLSWTASTDNVGVTGYDIYRGTTKVGTTASTSYTVTGLSPSTAYTFTVKAKDAAANESAASGAITVTTNAATGNVVTIYYKQGFTAPYIHYKLNGTWTSLPGVAIPAAEVTGYNKITINIGTATQLEACFNNGSGTWDSNNGANYFFPVGTSTYNAGTIVSGAPDTEPPTAPTNLASTGKTDTTVSLSWTASTDNVGVTSYEIYQGSSLLGTSTTTSYTATGLTANTAYTFTVKAKDAKNNVSSASNAITVTTNPSTGNTATIYYKRGYATPYIHYQPDSGSWTTAPGVAMTSSEFAGYSKITIQLGSASALSVAFNDGNGNWDNNGGSNYHFYAGTSTFVNGTITGGLPQADSLTIVVTAPSNTPSNADLYLASSLNGWSTNDSAYKLTKNTNGTYSITLYIASGTSFDFKVTKGSWAGVEANSNGTDISNRTFTTSGGAQTLNITVQRWKDQ